ncbi:MAG: hypothetical protein WCL50_17570, partial [Spirochaetota bacterium]
ESSILPARFGPGCEPALEKLVAEEGWLWFGTGHESIAFANAWNYELFAPRGTRASTLLAGERGSADFWRLREKSGLKTRDCAIALWDEVWEGRISSDTMLSLRQGLGNRFGRDLEDAGEEEGAAGLRPGARKIPLALRQRWRRGAPVPGNWSALDIGGEEPDPLDEEELDRERIRQLLRRYGIILRPLLERELGSLAWAGLFPCLRRMELSGELLFGHFFEGVAAPQFMGNEAFMLFQSLGDRHVGPIWLSAFDPASPAGFAFDARPAFMAARSASSSLCLRDGQVIALARRSGKAITFIPGLSDADSRESLGLWAHGIRKGRVETIDGGAAGASPFAEVLLDAGFDSDRGTLTKW